MMVSKRPLHLYVHVPFAALRSPACAVRVYDAGECECRAYCHALVREMEAAAPDFEDSCVVSVCFGGGSPTALPRGELAALMRKIRSLFTISPEAEITVEEIPPCLTAAQMVELQRISMNRLHVNLVTGRQKDCERLGLGFNLPASETALILAQMYGIRHYAAQLTYGLPEQTEANLLTSLRFAVKFNAPEIVLVSADDKPDAHHDMLEAARAYLGQKGYQEYLPLRFAKPGHACRQALGKAGQEDVLCFGPSTVSRTDGIIYSTTDNIHAYMAAPCDPAALYTVHDRIV